MCKIQAMQSLKNERYGSALDWAIRSHDNIFVTAIADRFLNVSEFDIDITMKGGKNYINECSTTRKLAK